MLADLLSKIFIQGSGEMIGLCELQDLCNLEPSLPALYFKAEMTFEGLKIYLMHWKVGSVTLLVFFMGQIHLDKYRILNVRIVRELF